MVSSKTKDPDYLQCLIVRRKVACPIAVGRLKNLSRGSRKLLISKFFEELTVR